MTVLRATLPAVALLSAAWFAPIRSAVGQAASESRHDIPATSAIGVDYSYTGFRDATDPWHQASLSLTERTARGSFIARVNYANRFATNGYQVEADAYPRVSRSMYAYLNAGYSASSIFPEWRFGGELFASLPSAWEASAGFRQLRFGGAPVTLFTGSVGKYVGNYWFSARPYVRSKVGGTSASASLTGRRYFEDGDHYIGARVGYGSAPGDQLTPDQANRSNSFTAVVQGSTGVAARTLGVWSFGYDSEQLTQSRVRKSFTGTAGLKYTF